VQNIRAEERARVIDVVTKRLMLWAVWCYII